MLLLMGNQKEKSTPRSYWQIKNSTDWEVSEIKGLVEPLHMQAVKGPSPGMKFLLFQQQGQFTEATRLEKQGIYKGLQGESFLNLPWL